MDRELRDLVSCARAWAKARAKCRRIADSKSAKPAALEAARRQLSDASDALNKSVLSLESFLRRHPKKRKNVDWQKLFGAVSVVAEAVEKSVRPKPFQLGVIDTTGEEV